MLVASTASVLCSPYFLSCECSVGTGAYVFVAWRQGVQVYAWVQVWPALIGACSLPTAVCCLQWRQAQPTLSLDGLAREQETAQLQIQYEPCLTLIVREIEICKRRRGQIKAAYCQRQQDPEAPDDELDKLTEFFLVRAIWAADDDLPLPGWQKLELSPVSLAFT